MKKVAAGLAILLLLLSAGLWNAYSFKNRMLELENHVRAASILFADGDKSDGVRLLENAIRKWEEDEAYTHIFLHHDGINDVTEAFYEYLGKLRAGSDDKALRDRLIYNIRSVYLLELPTLGAIF